MAGDRQLTAAEVLELVRRALATPPAPSSLRARLARARYLQQHFRDEPLGGKLVAFKKLFHWFTASAFDRQAKAVEATLDLAEELVAQAESTRSAGEPAAGAPADALAAIAKAPGEGVPSSLPGVLDGTVEMLLPERLLLYSLIFSLKPRRCLEIGTFRGGSAAIICSALRDNRDGRLVCVDPRPQIVPENEDRFHGRATVLEGSSPGILPRAREAAGGDFDFALIDGDHTSEGVLRDVEGVLGHVADGACLVLHDCHYHDVATGIDEALERHPATLTDCGVLSTVRNPDEENGRRVYWGGLRLLRVRRT